ncbi:MAG: hypothetical protein K0S55_1877 [Clostridia bacterium]|nr:hypothetical protein [Clostridia bacterium]
MTSKIYEKIFILIFILVLFTVGCSPKSEEVDLYILPDHEEEIYSMLSSDEDGKHIHIEYYVPKRGGQTHFIYCKICGQGLGEEEHIPNNKVNSIAYRGNQRYHVNSYICICKLPYAEEFFECLSDNVKCKCLEMGVAH